MCVCCRLHEDETMRNRAEDTRYEALLSDFEGLSKRTVEQLQHDSRE